MALKLFKTLLMLVVTAVVNLCFAADVPKKKVKKLFEKSPIVNNHFTGFELYDMDKQETVFELNADHYFIPASNTKLFTFYTSLKMLGDSIPALRYVVKGDSLLFWGTGDPSFLHPGLNGTNAYNFLKRSDKKLFYCTGEYQNERYGKGWAWDDYNDYYQAEINELPVAGNLISINTNSRGRLQIEPAYFNQLLTVDSNFHPEAFMVKRRFTDNTLVYPATPIPAGFNQQVPWQTGTFLTVTLLQDTLKKVVERLNIPVPANVKVIYNAPADSVYKHMLLTSDNFIAEQLLLVCSSVKYGYLNSDSVRQYAIQTYLNDLPDKPEWNDGSGLSRLNLFTPRSIIALLNKIAAEVKDEQKLHAMLPAGGLTGTLKKAYQTDNGQAFVWAKTGSLSNNYNQSGYLITREGHRLAFCFMNNNYTDATRVVRDEMARIITYIHDNF